MLSPGTRLGPYEIVAPLGAGGMGQVYRARDTRLDRQVAVKVLPPEFSARPESLSRFEREGKAVAALSHPNILAIHDIGTHDGTAYAVTELLEGETLRDALADGALPLRRAIDCAVQIARGLAAAHDKGIIHRDLKPENLFITGDGRVKILDFGLARQDAPTPSGSKSVAPTVHSPTDPGTVLGTVGYMAPEQVRGTAADQRADIFSFGCVLFEMVTGRRAFQRDTAAETMTAILRDDPPEATADTRVPPALDRIVRHCLEKKPEARFRSAYDLALALEAISGSSASAASSSALPAVPGRRVRGRAAIAMAMLLAVAAAGGVWYGRQSADRLSLSDTAAAPPTFRRVTFTPKDINAARFAPDGQTFVYDERVTDANSRLIMARLESVGATPLALPNAILHAISKEAELLAGINPIRYALVRETTLVRVPLLGGAPRTVLERVTFADWSRADGSIAAVHLVGSEERLEFPIGTVLYKTEGQIGFPRVSPAGDRVAFLDWPVKGDDRGTVVIVDRGGKTQTVSRPWDGVRGLAWRPSGDDVFYTAAPNGIDYAVWASRPGRPERLVYSAPGGLVVHDVATDGRVLLSRYDRSVHVEASVAGETTPRNLSWLGLSYARDLSKDGRVLLSYFGVGSSTNYDVYVRGLGDTEAVHVGEGQGQQFSPDGKSILAVVHGPPAALTILPIGPGDVRKVETGNVTVTQARWLPDGGRLLVIGTEPGHRMRAYVTDVAGSMPRPVTPEGITYANDAVALSRDGQRVAFRAPDGVVMLYSTREANASPIPVKGLSPTEMPVAWTGDDQFLVVFEGASPRTMVGVNPTTGRREILKTIVPSEPALIGPSQVFLSDDLRTYVANYNKRDFTLFVAEGLR